MRLHSRSTSLHLLPSPGPLSPIGHQSEADEDGGVIEKVLSGLSSPVGLKTLPPSPRPLHRVFWKESVVYQCYVSSFADSNGDGIGDLPGLLSRLDHIQALGTDVLWLNPVFRSPHVDMGYDIADYRSVDARYGSNQDLENVLKGCEARGMKLMLDIVVNHTSSEHEWFKASRSDKNHPLRNRYIWRPPRIVDGQRKPPNNWRANFGGSAWTFDPQTEEYYLHLFAPEQPDLNWEAQETRDAVWDLMKFWLDKGVAGFRLDVINMISKAEGLPDAPITVPGEELQSGHTLYCNGPRIHEFLHEMNTKCFDLYDRPIMTVGETPAVEDVRTMLGYTQPERKELSMCFHFEFMDLCFKGLPERAPRAFVLPELKSLVNKWQTSMHEGGGWNALYLENHDQIRSISRFASDAPEYRVPSGKMLALWQCTLSGTVYVYQGQELGCKNVPDSWPLDEFKDIATQNFAQGLIKSQDPDLEAKIKGAIRVARDNNRTPMQWDDSAHGGFTTGTPWMRVNDDFKECNAALQIDDEQSVFSAWKQLLALRKANEVLIYGDFTLFSPDHEQIFAYRRSMPNATDMLVVMNFSDQEVTFMLPLDDTLRHNGAKLLYGTHQTHEQTFNGVVLMRPYEGRLYQ